MSLALTHSPADILRWILIEESQGTDPEDNSTWPVFCSAEPDKPDNCITIYDRDGQSDGRFMRTGELQQHYGFQIRFRSRTHPEGFVKSHAIRTYITENIYNYVLTIEDVEYTVHAITQLSQVFSLGNESPTSKRRLFVINGTVTAYRAILIPDDALEGNDGDLLTDSDGNYLLGVS